MSIRKRERRDGTTVYDAPVRDVYGKEISQTFPNKTAAKKFSEAYRVDRDRDLTVRPGGGRTPFGETAWEWLTSNPGKRATSAHTDTLIIEKHLRTLLDRRIGVITRADMQQLVNGWAANYKPSTVVRYFAVPKAIFEFALNNDLIGKSPCRGIKLPRIERTRRPATLTAESISALCEAVAPHYRCLILFIAETGARPQEAFALRLENVNLMGRAPSITIAETVVEVQGRLEFGPPKSDAGNRQLTISPRLATELGEHLALRGVNASMPRELVFKTPDGEVIRSSNFRNRVWVPARVAAGVERATLYDLRRANATAMFDKGVDLSTAQKRLGHADPRMTMNVYAQRSFESDQRAAVRLGDWLAKPADEGGELDSDAG